MLLQELVVLDGFRSPALTFPAAMLQHLRRLCPELPVIRRSLVLALVLGAAAGCGNWKRVGDPDQPAPSETLTRALNTTEFYQRLGRLAGAEPLPFVGTVAFAAGPADSVIGVFGLSLENRALAFERDGEVFGAAYRMGCGFRSDVAQYI